MLIENLLEQIVKKIHGKHLGGFFALFSIDSKSAINVAFLDTRITFLQKNLFGAILALFAIFEAKRERNGG
jgi:hypothetical protein